MENEQEAIVEAVTEAEWKWGLHVDLGHCVGCTKPGADPGRIHPQLSGSGGYVEAEFCDTCGSSWWFDWPRPAKEEYFAGTSSLYEASKIAYRVLMPLQGYCNTYNIYRAAGAIARAVCAVCEGVGVEVGDGWAFVRADMVLAYLPADTPSPILQRAAEQIADALKALASARTTEPGDGILPPTAREGSGPPSASTDEGPSLGSVNEVETEKILATIPVPGTWHTTDYISRSTGIPAASVRRTLVALQMDGVVVLERFAGCELWIRQSPQVTNNATTPKTDAVYPMLHGVELTPTLMARLDAIAQFACDARRFVEECATTDGIVAKVISDFVDTHGRRPNAGELKNIAAIYSLAHKRLVALSEADPQTVAT